MGEALNAPHLFLWKITTSCKILNDLLVDEPYIGG